MMMGYLPFLLTLCSDPLLFLITASLLQFFGLVCSKLVGAKS